MRLAVFDIDGTLTDTCDVDAECYVAAVGSVFGLASSVLASEWESYPHITDSGIARTAVARHLGREVEAFEMARLETEFSELLTAELDRAPERCRPLPGAVEFLTELSAHAEWEVALATGGFRSSSLLKLQRAGFDPPVTLATSGDSIARSAIVQTAIDNARESSSDDLRAVVVLGDGPWDVRTSLELDLPCIGIGQGIAAENLLALGAVGVLEDYLDRGLARRLLATAAEGGDCAR